MRVLSVFLAACAVGAVATGCSASDPPTKTRVTGSVASGMTLDNPKAIAVTPDGRVYSAYLDTLGRFALDVPVGTPYRVLIANTTPAGKLRVVGHVMNGTATAPTPWLDAHGTSRVRLGTLQVSSASTAPAGLTTLSYGYGSSASTPAASDKDKDKDSSDSDYEPHNAYGTRRSDGDREKLCDKADDNENDVELYSNAKGYGGSLGDKDKDKDTGSGSYQGRSCNDGSPPAPPDNQSYGSPQDYGAPPQAPPPGACCHCSHECATGETCSASHCISASAY